MSRLIIDNLAPDCLNIFLEDKYRMTEIQFILNTEMNHKVLFHDILLYEIQLFFGIISIHKNFFHKNR